MKFLELKKKGPEDLEKEYLKIKMDLMKFKTQVATGGAGKDAGRIKELRKTIARIKTLEVQAKK